MNLHSQFPKMNFLDRTLAMTSYSFLFRKRVLVEKGVEYASGVYIEKLDEEELNGFTVNH